jgi:hypothetical protein
MFPKIFATLPPRIWIYNHSNFEEMHSQDGFISPGESLKDGREFNSRD